MHLNNEIAQNTCGICNRDFYSTETYEMHMKLHEGKSLHKHAQTEQTVNRSGRFKCQYCDKVFKRPYEKISHERVHTGEKPYSCEVCGKRFRVSYSLTMHLRTHTDVRPYECEVCKKRFKSQPVYAHHKRIHSGQRSFQCEQCNKTFQTSVQLSAHRNSHSKPFVCTVCERAFAALYLLRSHMQTHKAKSADQINIVKCEICGAGMREITLRQHMKKQHGISQISIDNSFNDNLVTHELDEMDLMSTNEIIEQPLNQEESIIVLEPIEPEDEQDALLIAVANAAEEFEQHSIQLI